MTSQALVSQPASQLTEPEILDRLKTVGDVLAPEAKMNAAELHLFAMVAARSGLDPFARQIHAIRRQGKLTFQSGIDGYRSGAARTNEYDGSDEPEFGPIVDKPFPHPEWARVTVYRRGAGGERQPQSATAWWDEFNPGPPNDFMWKKMPRNQLAKCAEALALRKRFPYVLADVYVDAEMDQADSQAVRDAEARRVASLPTASGRVAERRKAIEAQSAPSASPAPAADATPSGESERVTAHLPSAAGVPTTEQAAVAGQVVGDTTTGLTWQQFRSRMARANSTTGKVKAAASDLWPDRQLTPLPSEWVLEPADWAALAVHMSI